MFPSSGLTKTVVSTCQLEAIFPEVCANFLFLIGGYNSQQLDRTQIPDMLRNTPAGSSVRQIVHFAQQVYPGGFRQYDFGPWLNLRKYGSLYPPSYQLKNVVAPTVLWFGGNDWLAAVEVNAILNQQAQY